MSSAIESLMFVVEISASKLKALVQRLDSAEPRQVAGLISGIEKESTVLSQAVQKLSSHTDAIRDQEDLGSGPMVLPDADTSLLMVARLLRAIVSGSMVHCPACGGYLDGGGDRGCIGVAHNGQVNEVAYTRAHRAEEEAP